VAQAATPTRRLATRRRAHRARPAARPRRLAPAPAIPALEPARLVPVREGDARPLALAALALLGLCLASTGLLAVATRAERGRIAP
jgi:hypothetical protein